LSASGGFHIFDFCTFIRLTFGGLIFEFLFAPALGFFIFRCLMTILQYNTFFLVAKITALVAES
jgi:hypothetical protein